MRPLSFTRLSTVLFPMILNAARLPRPGQLTLSCHVALMAEGGESVNADLGLCEQINSSVVAVPVSIPLKRPAWLGQIISCSSLDLCSPRVQLIRYQQSE